MGFFGTFRYADGHWTQVDPGTPPAPAPALVLDIHDSDIATVVYRPEGSGSGTAYLGATPRTYFAQPSASEPTDADREAWGLAEWWASQHPGATDAERAAKQAELRTFLATDDDPDDGEDEDDDVFVEAKSARFLTAPGVPVPAELPA